MNKSIIKILFCLIIVSSCNNPKEKGTEDKKLATSETAEEKPSLTKYTLSGNATNVVVNKNAGVEIEVTEIGNKKYKCAGKFDEKTLFGRFEMYGEAFANPNSPNALSIKFSGQINFGDNDGSGFTPGTKTTFSSTINIFVDNATGDYLIDEIPNSGGRWSTTKQNGLYDLKINSQIQYSEK